MSDKEKQLTIAQSEFMKHEAEHARLQNLADIIMTDISYHARQMETWSAFIGSLATEQQTLPVILPNTTQRHLHLVPDILA